MQKSRVTAKLSLLEVFLKESFYLVVGNHTGNIVVKVNMGGTGDNHELLVRARHEVDGILAAGPFSTNIAEFYLFLPS